jgi:phosphopantetheine adenylyltransferase
VYENYNKFITATDTIRQMQTDFVSIEEHMDRLSSNMHKITQLSDRLGTALADKRDSVNRLAVANRTLKNLQFLFDLPNTLQVGSDSNA